MAYPRRPPIWETVIFFAVTTGLLYVLWGLTNLAFCAFPHPRHSVDVRRSNPQGIDNLHHLAGRGIICDGLAATLAIG